MLPVSQHRQSKQGRLSVFPIVSLGFNSLGSKTSFISYPSVLVCKWLWSPLPCSLYLSSGVFKLDMPITPFSSSHALPWAPGAPRSWLPGFSLAPLCPVASSLLYMDDCQSLCLLSASYFIWIHGFKQYLFAGHTHIFISSHNHFLVEQIIVGNEQQPPWAPGEVVSQAQNSRCSCWGWGLPCVSRSSWKGLGKEDRWSGVCFWVTAMAVERRMGGSRGQTLGKTLCL